MSLYPRILSYLKPHGVVFGAAVVAIVLFAGLDAFSLVLLLPFLETLFGTGGAGGAGDPSRGREFLDRVMELTLGRFVDLQGDPRVAIQGIVIFILIVFGLKNLVAFARAYLVARVEQGVTRDLRNGVYDHLLSLDLAFFGRVRVGQIISRLTHDVEQLRQLVTRELAKVVQGVFELLGALIFMVAISWELTLAAFVVVPGTMAVWGPLVKKLRRGDRKVLDLAGEVSSHIQETLAGIRMVKAASAEDHERKRFRGLTWDYFGTYLKTERYRALAGPITEMLAAVGTVVLLWYGAHLVLVEQALSGGAFITFLGLSMKLYSPMKLISKFPATVQPGLVGAERVFEFLDAPVEIRDRDRARPFRGVSREIRYRNVSFAYREGDEVLRDISFTAPRGSVTALVGPSGSGKTTLVDLLGRFYEMGSGSIEVDGVDIREFSIRSLRRALGIVSQETVLFHDTVRSNIAYGLADVDHDAVERAACAANAHDFITELPRGYDTVVGERGADLSGGQRQRIAIARAILRDPPILIFDEATSALDTESERLVQRAVERLLEGRTVFVIAHRLSTVQKADQILVVDEGRIVERGTHRELLALNGLYGRLHALQFRDPAEERPGERVEADESGPIRG